MPQLADSEPWVHSGAAAVHCGDNTPWLVVFPPGQVEANMGNELVAAAHARADRWLDADA
jgi:hypothetical protein